MPAGAQVVQAAVVSLEHTPRHTRIRGRERRVIVKYAWLAAGEAADQYINEHAGPRLAATRRACGTLVAPQGEHTGVHLLHGIDRARHDVDDIIVTLTGKHEERARLVACRQVGHWTVCVHTHTRAMPTFIACNTGWYSKPTYKGRGYKYEVTEYYDCMAGSASRAYIHGVLAARLRQHVRHICGIDIDTTHICYNDAHNEKMISVSARYTHVY